MNFYAARQREDGRWEYTCHYQEEGLVSPIGYCRPWEEWEEEDRQGILSDEDYANLQFTAHKHHSGGHGTREEAHACYREYLLDHCISFVELVSRRAHACALCGGGTKYWAAVMRIPHFPLCGPHCELEYVGQVLRVADCHGPF